ncbi:MAG: exo-alpha-sialidase [Victivallales bacterium]|nr:exo-alpha-sialidase [Victivallales bacterium]
MLSTNSNNAVTWVHPLPDGRLFTIASMDKCHQYDNALPCDQFLFGRISDDGGRTWGAPYHLYTWPERTPFMIYAGSMIDSLGHVHVFALRINRIDYSNDIYDGGISYVRLDTYKGGNPIYSTIPCLARYTGSLNSCVETSNGRLVIPFSTITGQKDSKFVSSVIYSDDYGLSWSASNDIAVVSDEEHIESGAVEPIVIELGKNTLLMLIRTVLGTFWYSMSRDDGMTWEMAKPTKITSSNAPGAFARMPDGRIFLAWNNVMGHPMSGIRYSFARQCLHGAVSDDNLRTLKGARILLKKRIGDTDSVHNAYPYIANAGDGEMYLRTFEVEGKGGSRWGMEQSYLTKVSPDFLEETEVHDNWNEWVCDVPPADGMVEIRPTTENVAYAMTSFPYAVSGEITVESEGELNGDAQILLSDCYLDRLNFMENSRPNTWDDMIHVLYSSMTVSESGVWKITWKDGTITLAVNGKTVQTATMASSQGLNHFGILFKHDGLLRIRHFEAKAFDNRWNTGIECVSNR